MYELLKQKNDAIKDQVLAFASKLIREPSPSLMEAKVAALVEEEMLKLGYDRVMADDYGNVIGVVYGTQDGPNMLLCSHMDTVEPNSEGKWERSPYGGEIAGGWLHGLGASDCKGGVATQVYSGALLKRCLLPLSGHLVVAATVAEENGLSIGTRELVERTLPEMNLEPAYAVLGEPTSLNVYHGHDGWVDLDLRVEGTDRSCVDRAAKRVYGELSAVSADENGAVEDLNVVAPVIDRSNGSHRATFRMTRRMSPLEDEEGVLAKMQYRASRAAGTDENVAVRVALHREKQKLFNGKDVLAKGISNSWETNPFHPIIQKASQALRAGGCSAIPGKWRLGRLGMGTAGHTLTEGFGIPTLGYGPGSEHMAHAVNESVHVTKVTEGVYGTAVLAHALVGIPVLGWASGEI